MKANDLRIGNIINRPTKGGSGYTYVTHRIISDLASHNNPLPYEPIPITEDWLLRFGFEIDRSYDYRKGFICWQKEPTNYGSALNNEKSNWFIDCGGDDEYYHVPIYHLQYVHQLQNLYFDLTGEELELK